MCFILIGNESSCIFIFCYLKTGFYRADRRDVIFFYEDYTVKASLSDLFIIKLIRRRKNKFFVTILDSLCCLSLTSVIGYTIRFNFDN